MGRFRRSRADAHSTPLQSINHVEVLGHRMAYRELGSGTPVLLLHLGVSSSFLWRKIMPYVGTVGRAIALDLLGTGESASLEPSGPATYTLEAHTASIDAFVEILDVKHDLTIVVHGLASLVGFSWASRHQSSLRALVHMESITRPTVWPDFDDPFSSFLKKARNPEGAEELLSSPGALREILSHSLLEPLAEPDRQAYELGFPLDPKRRRAFLTALTRLPVGGMPSDTWETVSHYSNWLRETPVPKLFIRGSPGYILSGRLGSHADNLPHQTVVEVAGRHLLPEDSPDGIGLLLRRWLGEQLGTRPV